MKRLLWLIPVTLLSAGCSVLPPRDFGCVAGGVVGADMTGNATGAVLGCVAGATLGMLAENRGYSGSAFVAIPGWADPATQCWTSVTRDHLTGAAIETTRCNASFRRPVPGGYEVCSATFESRSVNGGPHKVVRDTERCHFIQSRTGYRAY